MKKGKTIVLCGTAGVGKDTAGDILVRRRGFVRVGLADPLKRFCKEVFDFSDEQLWGSSEFRNAPDLRYPRTCAWCNGNGKSCYNEFAREYVGSCHACDGAGRSYLTPREALQHLGTDWGRRCYEDTWIELGRRTAREHNERGVSVVVTDARFINEIQGFRADGATIVRLYRPGVGLSGDAAAHPSETEILGAPERLFDALVQNAFSLSELAIQMDRLAQWP